MSNSKVRKALEAKEKGNKVYNAYKTKEDLLFNFQMVRAYYNDNGASVHCLVEKILTEKYNLPWQTKLVRKALNGIKGQRNGLVSIPQFKYEERVYDILSKFVHRKFDVMVAEMKQHQTGTLYPLAFRDIVNKYS